MVEVFNELDQVHCKIKMKQNNIRSSLDSEKGFSSLKKNNDLNKKNNREIQFLMKILTEFSFFFDLQKHLSNQSYTSLLYKLEYQHINQGEVLYKIGDKSQGIYIIIYGSMYYLVHNRDILYEDQNIQNIDNTKKCHDITDYKNQTIHCLTQQSEKNSFKTFSPIEESEIEQKNISKLFPFLVIARNLHKGDYFGEVESVKKIPRSGTLFAKENTHLLKIPIEVYQTFIQEKKKMENEKKLQFLFSFDIFACWKNRPQIFQKYFHNRKLIKGEVVYQQNEDSDYIYFIKYGQIELIKNNNSLDLNTINRENGYLNNQNQQNVIYNTGSYFGEREVLQLQVRTDSAICISQFANIYQIYIDDLLHVLCKNTDVWDKLKNNFDKQTIQTECTINIENSNIQLDTNKNRFNKSFHQNVQILNVDQNQHCNTKSRQSRSTITHSQCPSSLTKDTNDAGSFSHSLGKQIQCKFNEKNNYNQNIFQKQSQDKFQQQKLLSFIQKNQYKQQTQNTLDDYKDDNSALISNNSLDGQRNKILQLKNQIKSQQPLNSQRKRGKTTLNIYNISPWNKMSCNKENQLNETTSQNITNIHNTYSNITKKYPNIRLGFWQAHKLQQQKKLQIQHQITETNSPKKMSKKMSQVSNNYTLDSSAQLNFLNLNIDPDQNKNSSINETNTNNSINSIQNMLAPRYCTSIEKEKQQNGNYIKQLKLTLSSQFNSKANKNRNRFLMQDFLNKLQDQRYKKYFTLKVQNEHNFIINSSFDLQTIQPDSTVNFLKPISKPNSVTYNQNETLVTEPTTQISDNNNIQLDQLNKTQLSEINDLQQEFNRITYVKQINKSPHKIKMNTIRGINQYQDSIYTKTAGFSIKRNKLPLNFYNPLEQFQQFINLQIVYIIQISVYKKQRLN